LNDHYDYIIAGAGCAGLSLLCRMISSGKFNNKRILLTDKDTKNRNDRTWCFWETGEGYFEELVYKKWDKLWFHGTGFSKLFDTAPYKYKMIRGIDFYRYCFLQIKDCPNIDIAYGHVSEVSTGEPIASIQLNGKKITAELVFNSFHSPIVKEQHKHYLLQHFKGWIIETDSTSFNPAEATLMDFRVPQENGTSFVYVMPFSPTSALIEYTLFTPSLLQDEAYDEALAAYIANYLPDKSYTIRELEFGIIPMTNQSFPQRDGRIINIGIRGGLTKPSTGYTFNFIQRDAERIVNSLSYGEARLKRQATNKKFMFYDSVLLNVLATKKYPGAELFTYMFRQNKITSIFRFLDNESLLHEDLKLISTLPFFPFLKAGFRETVNNF
jgi:lycopene beta-cyclase